jgi:hypothetical protein
MSQRTMEGRALQTPEHPASEVLLRELARLQVPHGREHSFKLVRGGVLAGRLLTGTPRERLAAGAFASLAASLGMPAAAKQLLTSRLSEANAVLFATEDDGPRHLFKAYLEFWDGVRARVRSGDPSPQLLHLGVKWSSDRPGHHEEAHYTCHPLLGVHDVLRRMRGIYPPSGPDQALRIAQDLVRTGAKRRPGAPFLYLEATEAGNPRRSFDVNFYKTGLRVGDAADQLLQAAAHFEVDERRMRCVLEPLLALPLGHIAGGTARDGGEFLSVYAEIAPMPSAGDG